MLRLENLEVKYLGVILVLRGIYLQVNPRQIVALLGANGAGKSTTLKAISGLLKTEEGEITGGHVGLDGEEISRLAPEDIVRRGVVQVMEGRRILEHLSVEENLRTGALVRDHGRDLHADLQRVWGYFPRLRELRQKTSGYLSGGEQQMLVIGRALMSHPRFILLDEASLGLAPLLAQEIFRIVKRINAEEGTAFLLVEQNATAALSIADHGYVMENGRIVLDGPASRIRDNEDVREFYLGLTDVGARKSYREVKHYKRRKRWLS
ncbi:MAG: ABC transporter ATP-binding protein [Chloroflexota bacterium]